MIRRKMKYILTVFEGEKEELVVKPVPRESVDYLRYVVFPALQPLSDEEYMYGPAAILRTFAHFSYILDGEVLYWCIEWEPGLLVIEMSPSGKMRWSSHKSLNPRFGGREASEEEIANYDEDEPNHQYYIVFDAWDAQFEEIYRDDCVPIDDKTKALYESALQHANHLGDELARRYPDKEGIEKWKEKSKASIILHPDID